MFEVSNRMNDRAGEKAAQGKSAGDISRNRW
jgi:hypothetical protein